jgi:chitinase
MARNVIYYNNNSNPITLAEIANLPYTDVILAFAVVNQFLAVEGNGGAFPVTLDTERAIRALQNAGKNVLVSFGGDPSTFPSSDWQRCARNVEIVVNNIAAFVKNNGLNGVDIDYEDNAGFQGAYDGVGLLNSLTSGLATTLPPGRNIITHAPQTAYWDNSGAVFTWKTGGIAPYVRTWQTVGRQIAWINNQFYNTAHYDKNDATKVQWYNNVAAITGPQKLLMGVLLSGGEGIPSLNDMVHNVIPSLKATFGAQFGGVMSWQFSFDQGGSWAKGVGQALAA